MKKREKKLRLAKETLRELKETQELKAVDGAVGEEESCTLPPSTAGGSRRVCC